MSRDNVDLVRAAFKVWNARDVEGARELLSADVTLCNGANSPHPGPFVGREPVVRQLAQMRASSDAGTLEPVSDYFYAADRVAVRLSGGGAVTGPSRKSR